MIDKQLNLGQVAPGRAVRSRFTVCQSSNLIRNSAWEGLISHCDKKYDIVCEIKCPTGGMLYFLGPEAKKTFFHAQLS